MNNMDRQTLDAAISLFRQNQIGQAITQFELLSEHIDASAEVLRWLALSRAQSGDLAGAAVAIERAVDQPGAGGDTWLLASNIFADLQEPAKALQFAQRAADALPPFAQAFNNLGILLADLSRFEEACNAFARAVELNPNYVRAQANLATMLLKRGHVSAALVAADNAICLQSDNPLALSTRGSALLQLGRLDDAEQALRSALRLNPHLRDTSMQLALLYRRKFQHMNAITLYDAVLQKEPGLTAAAVAKGEALWAVGQEVAARQCWQQVMTCEPGNFSCALRAHLNLPETYSSAPHVQQSREDFKFGLDELLRQLPVWLTNNAEENLVAVQRTNFFLAYQGQDDLVLQQKYASLIRGVLRPINPNLFQAIPRRTIGETKIRIGFVGSIFYECTAGNYFASWVEDLPREQFDVLVYCTRARTDALTERIRRRADTFEISTHSLITLAQKIREAELDILIYPELGMDGFVFALAAFRLAPIQICAWGHPVTTGHENIDYFFSCESMESKGSNGHYVEKLMLLPGIGTRYAMPLDVMPNLAARDAMKTAFGLPTDRTLYLFPQSLFKIHPDNDALVVEILRRDVRGVLVMFAGENVAASERFFTRLRTEFSAQGVNFSDRVVALKSVSHADYRRINALCDVMLDTLYWSGGNASLDALSVGLPIVTLPGEFMRGRQSAGMLSLAGIDELIARSRDDYIRIALQLGIEPAYRAVITQRILANRNRLFNDVAPLRTLHRQLCMLAEST
jgi:protein O-GlcNAc transferase